MRISWFRSPLRVSTSLSVMLSVTTQMFWWSTPAQAQSLLQQLFGLSSTPQTQQAPPRGSKTAPRPITAQQNSVPWRIESNSGFTRQTSAAPEGSGSYTTVCVRMCDGYHFPISFRVPRSRFYRDADVCRSRCGMSDARLFYHPSTGPEADMNSATDLTGRSYARLPIAFLHRKKLVSGCGCRPEPWAEASIIRHDNYAIAAGAKPSGSRTAAGGGVTVVAGEYAVAQTETAEPSSNSMTAAHLSADDDPADTDKPAETAGNAIDPAPLLEQPSMSSRTRSNRAKHAPAVAGRKTRAAIPSRVASPARPRKPANLAIAASSTKLTWPGDAPTRTR